MDDLYRDYILEHYRHPRNSGTLEHPDATHEDDNPLCGDRIRKDLSVLDGRLEQVKFSGRGCAISQASASMLTEQIKGQNLEDVARLPPQAVLDNVGIGISATRMRCAMLGLKVLKSAALGEIAGWPDEE